VLFFISLERDYQFHLLAAGVASLSEGRPAPPVYGGAAHREPREAKQINQPCVQADFRM